MSVAEPFIQGKAHELKQVVPMLKGCFAQVFLLVGAYEVDPLGLTFTEIVELTGLTKPSVSAAIKFLSRNNLIVGQLEEDAIRYRACFGFYYRSEKVNLRDEMQVKNIFTPVVDDVRDSKNNISERKQQTTGLAARKILKECGIYGKALIALSEVVNAETATEWREWVESAPKGFRNPQGLMISALLADPEARPPQPLIKGEAPRKAHISGALAHVAQKDEQ